MELKAIGWREWVALPELGIDYLKVKVDTGARTSALHTFALERFIADGQPMVRFQVHPLPRRSDVVVSCAVPIADERWVTDSGGHRERRYVIVTQISLGDEAWPIEVTLTNRDDMRFRMLLGRTAMDGRFLVDPTRSYLCGRRPAVRRRFPTRR